MVQNFLKINESIAELLSIEELLTCNSADQRLNGDNRRNVRGSCVIFLQVRNKKYPKALQESDEDKELNSCC